jgi:hypothetical protein
VLLSFVLTPDAPKLRLLRLPTLPLSPDDVSTKAKNGMASKKKIRKETHSSSIPMTSRPELPTYVQKTLFQTGSRIRKAVSDGYKRPSPVPIKKGADSGLEQASSSNTFSTSISSMSSNNSNLSAKVNAHKRRHEEEDPFEEDNCMLADLENEAVPMDVTITDADLDWIHRNGFEAPKFLSQ